MSILGFDCSHFSGTVKWDLAYKQGMRFCYAKASEGIRTLDLAWKSSRSQAKDAGIALGSYHFVRSKGLVHEQINWMLNCVDGGPQPGDMPLVIDIEQGSCNPEHLNWIVDFVHALKDELGSWPVIYTGPAFWDSLGWRDTVFGNCPLWIAQYGANNSVSTRKSPMIPKPWTDWAIWQNAGNQKTAWCNNCDLNVFAGDEFAFELFRVKT